MATGQKGSSVERYYAAKQRKRKARKIKLYFALVLIIIAAFVTLSLTVFFNIRSFQIQGNTVYTTEQILESAGVAEGDNLFRLNKFKMEEQMTLKLPYIGSVNIYRKLPGTLCMDIVETKPVFVTYQSGSFALLDDSMKVLKLTDEIPEGLILLIGDTLNEPTPGTVGTFAGATGEFLPNLVEAFRNDLDISKVSALDVSDRYNLRFYYDNSRVRVLLGNTDNLSHKMQMTQVALNQNSVTDFANIDITSGDVAYYRVLEEEERDDTEAMFLGKEPDTQTPDDGDNTADQDTDAATDENTDEDS